MNFTTTSFGARFALSLSILLFFASLSTAQTQQASLVKDIQVGTASSNPTNFTSVGNIAYFTADDGAGSALWKSDGSPAGTVKVGSLVGNPQGYNGLLYFTTKFSVDANFEAAILWSYNGSTSAIVDTIKDSRGLISKTFLSVIGSNLVIDVNFYPLNSSSETVTLRYLSKGTTGTIKKGGTISERNGGCGSYSYENTYLADTLAFYDYNVTTCGVPTFNALNSVKKGNILDIFSYSLVYKSIFSLGTIGNRLIFIAPVVTNSPYIDFKFNVYSMGVDGDTVRLTSNVSISLNSPPFASNNKASFNNKIYFTDSNNKIWETNGTSSGTVPLTDGTTTTLPLSMNNPIVLADGLYFYDAYNSEYRIWKIGLTGNISKILSIPTATDKDIKLVNLNNALWQFTNVNTNSTTDKPVYLYKIDVVNGTRQSIAAANGLDFANNNFVATGLKLFASANNATATNVNPTGQELYQMSIDPSVANCANDNVAPYFGYCPTSTVKNITSDRDTAWYPYPTAFDNCSSPSVTANITGFYANNAVQTGNTVIISKDSTARFEYTATDAKGNSAKCIFTVKVLKPCVSASSTFTIPCPLDTTIQTLDACTRVSWQVPTAVDNCGNVATVTQSSGSPSGSCFPVGVQTITYNKQYGGTCSFKITVTQIVVDPCLNDIVAPILSNCPANINLTTTGITAVATWTAPTATDLCTATPSVSSNYTSGSSFSIGTTAVTYTATDVRNNTVTCRFNITVSASTAIANCTSKSNAPWSEWIAQVQLNTLNNATEKTRADRYVVGYSDWKDKTTTISRSQTYPLSITPGLSWAAYQTNLFFRAWIDYNANGIYEDTELVLEKNSVSSTVNQSVTIPTTAAIGTTTMRVSMKKDAYPTACETFAAGEVEDYSILITNGTVDPCATDVTPPVLTNCPVNISVTTTGTTAVATWTTPTATDNCTTTPPSVSSPFSSGQSFPIGTTTVVYTARDAANNSTTCSFSIVVSASTVTANCVSKSNAPWNEWISNVQFNTLNNTSSKTRDDRFVVGYSDWKDKSTTVSRSQTHPLSITPGLSWPGYQTPLYFRAWIDFNRNGIYEDTELVLEKNSNSAVVNQSVMIPATASIGTTTMRISMKKGAYATACESFDLGEVEDYTIVIQDGNPTSCANNVLNFDGIDDYLQTPQSTIPANSDFTMEASFTSTATTVGCSGSFKRLLSLELSNSSNRLEIGECAGQLTLFYFINGGNSRLVNLPTATNLRDGNWHHIVAVKRGDVLSVYYDGVQVLTETGLLNINNVQRGLYVGRWGLQGENWQGNVDEVRVWNYAVSETDIVNRRNCQLSGTELGLILYFPFNQGVSSGSNTTITNVIDKSPSNLTTPMSNFGKQGSTSNFICSTQTLTQGCTTTDPCATDVTPPVFQNCPQNINLTALAGSTTAIATWTAPTATDACSTPSVSSNYTGGGTFFIGTTTVIYTATDVRNNTATCSFNVVVAPPANTCRYNDSLVLVDVYNSMGGSNWVNKWDLTKPMNTWVGIGTDTNGCVIAFSSGQLTGNLAPSIGNLSQLRYMRLGGSRAITGTIPNSFANLSNLIELQIEDNQLTGSIPSFVGNLRNLNQILLYKNMLTGPIPTTFGNLNKMQWLILNNNQLSGVIPTSLSNMSLLNALELSNNSFTGSIPNVFGQIPSLTYLGLKNNNFSGTLPKNLAQLTNINKLDLSNNLLSGCIPNELKPLCGKDVILSGNINLPNGGDWTTFCSTNAGACPVTNDLEVSVIANAPTFKKWTNTGFKVNLKNLGSQAFTNIELTFPYPAGTVNGGTPTPSVGTFQQYCAGGILCYKWTIPSLAAGVTATLDVPLFALDVAIILGTAQLLTSTPTDGNAANNTATATMTLQTIVPSLTSKPTQLIPVVIQTLSPNPTDGELNLKLESLDTREVTFEFYNTLGKTVKSETRVVEKGLNRLDFSLFDLEQGVYFVVPLTGLGRKVPTKFVKL